MKLNYFKILRKLMPKAGEIFNDKERFKNVLDESIKKTDKNILFKSISHELKIVFLLGYDFLRGRYKKIGKINMIVIIAALLYLLNPIDIVPDFIIGIGLIDDLTVLTYVFKKIKYELDRYEEWREEDVI